MPTRARRPASCQLLSGRELGVAELLPHELVRPLGVRAGEGHGHVEVGAASPLGRGEQGRVEPRIAGVEERVGALGLEEGDHGVDVARVHLGRPEALVAVRRHGRAGPVLVDVGQHEALEEATAPGHPGGSRPHSTGAHDDDAHGPVVPE